MRADLTDPTFPDWHKYLFTCASDDCHFLLMDWWDDIDGDYVDNTYPCTLDIVPCVWAPTWRQRITTAIKVLLGRRNWTSDCVLLDEPTALRLRDTIDEFVASEQAKRQRRP